MEALLAIDIQVGSFTSAPRMDAQNIISRINRLGENLTPTEGRIRVMTTNELIVKLP